jgi:GNAT superfamily N-acetyltransferase
LAAIAEIQAASPEAAQWMPADYLAQLLLVAAGGTGVVGFVAARPVADREFEILNLAVAPEFRRQGIARELLEALFHDYHGTFSWKSGSPIRPPKCAISHLDFSWLRVVQATTKAPPRRLLS